MRASLAVAASLLAFTLSFGQDAKDDPDAIVWSKAFSSISASQKNEFVLVLITNDDPFLATEEDPNKLAKQLWCSGLLGRAVRRARLERPDLRDRVRLQPLPVGMPANLTGGQASTMPSRCVVAVCDGNYRLLAFCVGVPDTDALLTLIEDAEEVLTVEANQRQDGPTIIAALAQRSRERLSRMWHAEFDTAVETLGTKPLKEDTDAGASIVQQTLTRLDGLSRDFDDVYVADVRMRFALSDAVDTRRLLVLEQHPQTRRPWCEAILPFLAGSDFSVVWNPLCERLWGFQPVRADHDISELLTWWDDQIESGAVVLSLNSPIGTRHLPWPPANADSNRRALGWSDAERLMLNLGYRQVDAEQLSLLLDRRSLKAIDINTPSRVRYIMFDQKRKLPIAVRQTDAPGKFVGMLKKAQ